MLTLCAGLEDLFSVCDTKIDALVIAGFEMQCVVLRIAAPVAAVQNRIAYVEDGGRRWLTVLLGQYHQDIVRHPP